MPGTHHQTKYGDQPWRAMVQGSLDRHVNLTSVSVESKLPYHTVRRMGRGYLPPDPRLRDVVMRMLDLPEDQLFTDEARAAMQEWVAA